MLSAVLLITALDSAWTAAAFKGPLSPIEEVAGLKCVGQSPEESFCLSGLCFDSIHTRRDIVETGCATLDICNSTGCSLNKEREKFVCCCSNDFCNGKSHRMVKARWRMFQNGDLVQHVPAMAPRLMKTRNAGVERAGTNRPKTDSTPKSNGDARQTEPKAGNTPKPAKKPEIRSTTVNSFSTTKTTASPKGKPAMKTVRGAAGTLSPPASTSTSTLAPTSTASMMLIGELPEYIPKSAMTNKTTTKNNAAESMQHSTVPAKTKVVSSSTTTTSATTRASPATITVTTTESPATGPPTSTIGSSTVSESAPSMTTTRRQERSMTEHNNYGSSVTARTTMTGRTKDPKSPASLSSILRTTPTPSSKRNENTTPAQTQKVAHRATTSAARLPNTHHDSSPSSPMGESVQESFPWYAIAIFGFLTSVVVFLLIYMCLRRCNCLKRGPQRLVVGNGRSSNGGGVVMAGNRKKEKERSKRDGTASLLKAKNGGTTNESLASRCTTITTMSAGSTEDPKPLTPSGKKKARNEDADSEMTIVDPLLGVQLKGKMHSTTKHKTTKN